MIDIEKWILVITWKAGNSGKWTINDLTKMQLFSSIQIVVIPMVWLKMSSLPWALSRGTYNWFEQILIPIRLNEGHNWQIISHG